MSLTMLLCCHMPSNADAYGPSDADADGPSNATLWNDSIQAHDECQFHDFHSSPHTSCASLAMRHLELPDQA